MENKIQSLTPLIGKQLINLGCNTVGTIHDIVLYEGQACIEIEGDPIYGKYWQVNRFKNCIVKDDIVRLV